MLIVDNRGMKRHVVGKKYIRHYAAGRVSASFGDASIKVAVLTTVLKHFVKGGDTKFYRYPREPECQRRWILPSTRCDWGSNGAYPHMEQLFQRFALITALEVVPVALEGSDDTASQTRLSSQMA